MRQRRAFRGRRDRPLRARKDLFAELFKSICTGS
jgi:hypothetical protein